MNSLYGKNIVQGVLFFENIVRRCTAVVSYEVNAVEMMAKNLKRIIVIAAVILAALALRLAYIQIIGGDELAAATRMQSLIALEGSNTRGIIYDRNGAPLVADSKTYVYIIKSEKFNYEAESLLNKLGAGEVNGNNEGYYVYSSEKYDRKLGSELISNHDAYILQASARYSENQIAEHLIGYVNRQDKSGATGLELMYDDELSDLNRHIYAVADVTGNILQGRELVITSDEKNDSSVKSGIRTTVDKQLQMEVEEIISDVENDCAVVILDCRTGGVAAMACTPRFDPADIDAHLNSNDNELINKVMQGEYAPGSVFKIVVAAAALENGIDQDVSYYCGGYTSVGNLTIGCETGGENGHGLIGFSDAFAHSCNSFFIRLGQQIGSEKIIETAQRFGLGQCVIDGFPYENSGHLMTSGESYGDAIGNLSIGQGETLVTPIQIAAMTNIIANRGIDKGVHLLINDEADDERVISENTARVIMEMMEAVSTDGTAAGLEFGGQSAAGLGVDGKLAQGLGVDGKLAAGANLRPAAAVKTGTAEYGQDGDGRTHAWITGYTPCDEPEYTITVFVEDGVSGSGSAGPVLEKIIRYLEKSGSYSKPTLA